MKKKESRMFFYEVKLMWLFIWNNLMGIHYCDLDKPLNINSRSNNISKKYCELH